MNACLSEFALDDVLAHGQASPEVEAHLRDCARCQARYAERRQFCDEFQRNLAAPLLHKVRRTARRRPRWLWLGAPVLAAAACVVFWLKHPGADEYVGAKGATAQPSAFVDIYCRRGDRTFVVAEADAVQPGDDLRFVPGAPSAAHFIQVASLDGRGTYTPFYPPSLQGESVPLPEAGQPLPGSIRLDDAPGPETLIVVYSERPLPVADVRVAALRAAEQGWSGFTLPDGSGSLRVLKKDLPRAR